MNHGYYATFFQADGSETKYDYEIDEYHDILQPQINDGLFLDEPGDEDEIDNILSSPTPAWNSRTSYRHPSHGGINSSDTLENANGAYTANMRPQLTRTRPHHSREESHHVNEKGDQESIGNARLYHHDGHLLQFEESVSPSVLTSSTARTCPRNIYAIRLRPVSELPDMFRGIFKFGVFNAVQSSCFDEIMSGESNLVISAPTGSGKTVLFELGIIQTFCRGSEDKSSIKCIYVAPTKALCSERFRDWVAKFEPIGLKCCELTGDTVNSGRSVWNDAKNASIIITTCEKWDSLTRNWYDHIQIFSQIRLFLVDEVHILNESRGSTLEVVTSRMKLRGSSLRFMLVSATVPNIDDVAHWIGSSSTNAEPAKVFEFGDDYRPCKLTRHVVPIPRRNGQNDFQFANILDYKLFAVMQQYSVGKPTLIFCSTRKGVFSAAERLMKAYTEAETKRTDLPWTCPPRNNQTFQDKRLEAFCAYAIGVHHAGLSIEDRRLTEDLFLKGILRVLVATSTLAVGVNLPAHMVVIKGVQTFHGNVSKEYSDLDIVQMLGRAGRPQFDNEGVAVIICEAELEAKYRALAQGNTVLESSLHLNLAEHLNSEISLGTITDVESAKSWLRGSFLFQRIRKNPIFYSLTNNDSGRSWQERIDDVVTQNVAQLEQTRLIDHIKEGDKVGKLTSTQYGEIMSKFYIRRATVSSQFTNEQFFKENIHPSDGPYSCHPGTGDVEGTGKIILAFRDVHELMRRLELEMISAAEELQDAKLRASEKTILNKLGRDIDVRFEVKVEKTCDKIFVLIQAMLGGISLNAPEYKSADSQLYLEAYGIYKHITRIARAVVEVAIIRERGAQVKHGLELLRCLNAKAWEDRAIVLRQIEHIGEKSIKILAEHGITSLDSLRKQNPLRIEALLNRRPPFGLDVLASVSQLPQYILKVTEEAIFSDGGKNPIEVDVRVECGLVEGSFNRVKLKKQHNHNVNMSVILTLTSDMRFIDFRRISTKALQGGKSFVVTAELTKPSQSVVVLIASETIAGATLQRIYKPSVSASEYPVMDTRPLSLVEHELAGLEEDPDFWNNMDMKESDEIPIKKNEEQKPGLKDMSRNLAPQDTKLQGAKLEARVLPSGKFECNHSCRDKSKCRHLCCRDGLLEPPMGPGKKKFQQLQTAKPEVKSSTSLQRLHPTGKISKLATKHEERIVPETESYRDRTDVTKSVRLSDCQRLEREIGGDSGSRRKRRAPPEYHIDLTDLRDSTVASMALHSADDDSDELPEAILPSKGSFCTPEAAYSDPDPDFFSPSIPKDLVDRCFSDDASQLPNKRRKKNPDPYSQVKSKDRPLLKLSGGHGGDGVEPSSSFWPSQQNMVVDVEESISHGGCSFLKQRIVPKPLSSQREEPEDDFAELDQWLQSGLIEFV